MKLFYHPASTASRPVLLFAAEQLRLVGKSEAHRLDRPLEEQQESVTLVDLAAAVGSQQVTRNAVVACHQIGRGCIAQALDELGARDQVAQQQRADRGRG